MLFTEEEFIVWKRAIMMIIKWYEKKFADRKSTRLNSSHVSESRMPSSA